MHPFQLCRIDLTAAHQSASIVLTAKFGSRGQLASLQCQLSFPVAAWSILSPGSKPVDVQLAGCIWRPGWAYFPSFNVLFFSQFVNCCRSQQNLTVGNGSKEGAFHEDHLHALVGMFCRLCNGKCSFWLGVCTLSLSGKRGWCSKAATADWKVWHLVENRSCWPAQCWVSKWFLASAAFSPFILQALLHHVLSPHLGYVCCPGCYKYKCMQSRL